MASAASGGAAAGSSSYSTTSSAAASHAATGVSAAIATTGTPTACTTPSAMIGCGGTFMSGIARFTGMGPRWRTSSPVTTATTPGARADRLDVEPRDARVTVRGADEDDRERAERPQVVDEPAGAEEQATVFATLHGPPDVGVGRARGGPWGAVYFPPMDR